MSSSSGKSLSVTALIVSGLSLLVSALNYFQDQYYKEISLKPDLIPVSIDKNNTIVFRNSGIGYAVLKNVGFGFDGKCLSSKPGADTARFYEAADTVFKNYKELSSKLYETYTDTSVSFSTTLKKFNQFKNEIIISPKSDFFLFSIENRRNSPARVHFLDDKKNDDFINKEAWTQTMGRLTVEYNYCTITGRTCFVTQNSNKYKSCLPQ